MFICLTNVLSLQCVPRVGESSTRPRERFALAFAPRTLERRRRFRSVLSAMRSPWVADTMHASSISGSGMAVPAFTAGFAKAGDWRVVASKANDGLHSSSSDVLLRSAFLRIPGTKLVWGHSARARVDGKRYGHASYPALTRRASRRFAHSDRADARPLSGTLDA
jgi:hypothetical protein